MDKRRFGIALITALVISLAITSVFYFRVRGQQQPATRHVVAAGVALPAGVPITAENLTEIRWPDNVPLEGVFDRKEDVVGRIPSFTVAANDPILKRDLASSANFGLAAKIPEGMRATAVKTNEVNNVAGFIFPGSHVDVLATLRGANNAIVTRTVLQNVQVLSTGSKTEPDPNGKPENVGVITLLVSPEESEKVALAETQGQIQFVLRNTGDAARSETPDVNLGDISGEPAKQVVQVKTVKCPRLPAPAPRPVAYSVETLAAGKSTVATFKTAADGKPQQSPE